MPLREGSSDKVVQENIQCILNKDGCGYDPPYKDPAREVYTSAQAAAIAYAKAGRRNNTGGKSSPSKKSKSSTPTDTKTKPKTSDTSPGADIKVPEGWKVQQPGGDADSSKKNQPPKKEEEELSPEADKQMLDEVVEGYKLKWGSGASLISDAWDTYDPKQKKKFLQHAKKIKAEEQAKQSKEDKNTPPASAPTPAQAPAPSAQSTPAPSGGDTDADESEKMLQDLLDSPDVNDAYKKALKNQWQNSTPEEKKAIHDQYVKNIKPSTKPQAPQPQTPAGWNSNTNTSINTPIPTFNGDDLVANGKTYKKTKVLPGSTKPWLYSDENGTPSYVVKEGGAEGQNVAEYTANQIYKAINGTGIDSTLDDSGKLINKFVKGSTLENFSPEEMAKSGLKRLVRNSLAIDALLANWDYAGLNNDNIMVLPSGNNVMRIDTGGTFDYRAQGGDKPYTPIPLDLWTLRNSSQGQRFWDDATEDDIKDLWTRQVKDIADRDYRLNIIIDKSKLSDSAKNAFKKRLEAFNVVTNELELIKNKVASWKEVDGAIQRAFEMSKNLDPNAIGWTKTLRTNLRSELANVSKTGGGGFDYDWESYGMSKASAITHLNKADRFDKLLRDKTAGHEIYNGVDVSDNEKYSIVSYTGGGYDKLNKYLRYGILDDPKRKEYYETKAKNLDLLLNKLPGDTRTCYRMNAIKTTRKDEVDAINMLKPGDEIDTAGFDSYTRDEEGYTMDEFTKTDDEKSDRIPRLRFISVYNGKNVCDVDPISDCRGESESLMKRGTKLKVTKIETVPVSNFPGLHLNESQIKVIHYEDAN